MHLSKAICIECSESYLVYVLGVFVNVRAAMILLMMKMKNLDRNMLTEENAA